MRIGHGFDVHKFGGEGPITVGGVKIEHAQGLLAHSDGDVLLHALCDAILGAAAMGDIGKHFPDTDDAYAGADSRVLLRHVVNIVKNKEPKTKNPFLDFGGILNVKRDQEFPQMSLFGILGNFERETPPQIVPK